VEFLIETGWRLEYHYTRVFCPWISWLLSAVDVRSVCGRTTVLMATHQQGSLQTYNFSPRSWRMTQRCCFCTQYQVINDCPCLNPSFESIPVQVTFHGNRFGQRSSFLGSDVDQMCGARHFKKLRRFRFLPHRATPPLLHGNADATLSGAICLGHSIGPSLRANFYQTTVCTRIPSDAPGSGPRCVFLPYLPTGVSSSALIGGT
jgi:hypothetical protein